MFCAIKQRSVVSAFSRDLLRWGTQTVGRLWVGNSRVGVGVGGGWYHVHGLSCLFHLFSSLWIKCRKLYSINETKKEDFIIIIVVVVVLIVIIITIIIITVVVFDYLIVMMKCALHE